MIRKGFKGRTVAEGRKAEPLLIAAADILAAKHDWLVRLGQVERLSPRTLAAYTEDVESFCRFLTLHNGEPASLSHISALSASDMRAYLSQRRREGAGSRSLARALSALRNFFSHLERDGLAKTSALALVRGPKLPERLPRAVTETEAEAMLKGIGAVHEAREGWVEKRDEAVLYLLYGAGLRISEALSLTRQGLGEIKATGVLRIIGKGQKERIVPVLPVITSHIEDYLKACPFDIEPDAPIFRGTRGKPLGARAVQSLVEALRAQLGLGEKVTPHALRHAFATHLLQGGGDLRTIQELLGHANLSTTQIYTRLDAKSLETSFKAAHPRGK